MKELEELRHGQVAPKAKPIKNSSDEEVTEQAGRKAKPIKNGGDKEETVARRARVQAKRKRAKRRVAEIQAELEALDDTVATRTGGASSPARPKVGGWLGKTKMAFMQSDCSQSHLGSSYF